MSAVKGGYISTLIHSDYSECYYLINLQTVGYLISFFIVYWEENRPNENHETLKSFIEHLYSKTLHHAASLKKVRRLLLTFLNKHPPVLGGTRLTHTYIEQVLIFV